MPVGYEAMYARVTPDELDRAVNDPAYERDLETRLFDDGDYECWFLPSWEELHHLLTMAKAPIDVVLGQTAISDNDWSSYGPARYLTANQVTEAIAYFRATPWQHLASHFDPAAMTAAGIYDASYWDREDKAQDALHDLKLELEGLVEFLAKAAGAGDAVITILGG